MKYRILASRINYPTSEAIVARILRGEDVPHAERGEVSHLAGEEVEDVPISLATSMIRNGDIEEVVEE